jgi:prepilin-type N-terminal cleavage/methylation domain-containing protein
MSRNCRSDRGDRGFTLIEVTVAMTVLVIILVMSATLLISLKSFAQKQQSFAEPRQTARRAMNYLAYYMRGASDMNVMDTTNLMPDALVTYYNLGSSRKQATYNNVSSATLADVGTDIITVAKPVPGSSPIKMQSWDGGHTTTSAAATFTQGCGNSNDDTANLNLFNQVVGYDTSASTSSLFTIYDPAGFWQYYAVNGAATCNCANVTASPAAIISMSLASGGTGGSKINPPGASTPRDLTCSDGNPCYMTAGIQFVTFRVRTVNGTPRLEQLAQPTRLFDASQDAPGTSFTPLLDGIEDLQIAYLYGDGTIWNTSDTSRLLQGTNYPNNVPYMQAEGTAANTYDAVNVRGVRISVVARSSQPLPTFLGGTTRRTVLPTPPEDSTVTYNTGYYHYRLTSIVMLQNRVLGN